MLKRPHPGWGWGLFTQTQFLTVEDIYETEGFESFICKIAAAYAEESVLTAEEKQMRNTTNRRKVSE